MFIIILKEKEEKAKKKKKRQTKSNDQIFPARKDRRHAFKPASAHFTTGARSRNHPYLRCKLISSRMEETVYTHASNDASYLRSLVISPLVKPFTTRFSEGLNAFSRRCLGVRVFEANFKFLVSQIITRKFECTFLFWDVI